MPIFHLIMFAASCRPRSDSYWRKDGNEECCSDISGKCGEGDGDCDDDDECEGSLECGKDNCPWGDGDDCCFNPRTSKNEISLIRFVGPYTVKAITLGVNVTSFHNLPLLAARTSSTKFDA